MEEVKVSIRRQQERYHLRGLLGRPHVREPGGEHVCQGSQRGIHDTVCLDGPGLNPTHMELRRAGYSWATVDNDGDGLRRELGSLS